MEQNSKDIRLIAIAVNASGTECLSGDTNHRLKVPRIAIRLKIIIHVFF